VSAPLFISPFFVRPRFRNVAPKFHCEILNSPPSIPTMVPDTVFPHSRNMSATNTVYATGATREDETSNQSGFSSESRAKRAIHFTLMRLISTKQLW